jgi:hypothetical protein
MGGWVMEMVFLNLGMNIVVFPCGNILAIDELYGSESLSQVLLPVYNLMKLPTMMEDISVLIHDNACKFAAFVRNRRSKSVTIAKSKE